MDGRREDSRSYVHPSAASLGGASPFSIRTQTLMRLTCPGINRWEVLEVLAGAVAAAVECAHSDF